MSGLTLYTERGSVTLTRAQMRLYKVLATERFSVFTTTELCRTLSLPRDDLDAVADALRARIAAATGLRLVQAIWGVGYRLEHLPERGVDDDGRSPGTPPVAG